MEPRAVATVAMAVGEEDLAAAARAATGRKVVEMEETSARTYSRFARIPVRPHMGGR